MHDAPVRQLNFKFSDPESGASLRMEPTPSTTETALYHFESVGLERPFKPYFKDSGSQSRPPINQQPVDFKLLNDILIRQLTNTRRPTSVNHYRVWKLMTKSGRRFKKMERSI